MAITNDMLADIATEKISTLEQLYNAQEQGAPSRVSLPRAYTICDIDLKTRTINSPEFISVRRDHRAETIYFKVDRYVDYMDLANTACVIEYIIPGDKEKIPYLYVVPFYDTVRFSEENKMIFPWNINGPATINDGVIEYAVRFFKVVDDGSKLNLVYSLSTLPAQSKILPSLENSDSEIMNAEYDVPVEQYENLIQQFSDNKVYWNIL